MTAFNAERREKTEAALAAAAAGALAGDAMERGAVAGGRHFCLLDGDTIMIYGLYFQIFIGS